MKPNAMPSVMLKVNGITVIVMKAGMYSCGSSQAIWPTLRIMNAPTIIKAGATVG